MDEDSQAGFNKMAQCVIDGKYQPWFRRFKNIVTIVIQQHDTMNEQAEAFAFSRIFSVLSSARRPEPELHEWSTDAGREYRW